MTLEEKLHKEFDWLFVKHVNPTNAIKEIVALHQQEIDEACKKQREDFIGLVNGSYKIALEEGLTEVVVTLDLLKDAIIDLSPSPKESE